MTEERVENVSNETQEQMLNFLKRHEDFCLFLLGNFEAYGPRLTEAPNSGNFKLIKQGEEVAGVFCLAKRGTLLIQSEKREEVFNLVLQSCEEESLSLSGVIGEWSFCHSFWNFLKHRRVIQEETFASKEVLYCLELRELPPEEKKSPGIGPGRFFGMAPT